MDAKSKKMLVVGALVTIFAIYRIGSPYLERTRQLEKESVKLAKKLEELSRESVMYGKGWEDNMTKQEGELAKKLPDTINSSDILNYFINEFEKKNPGKAWFLAVNYQRAAASEFKAGKTNKAPRARAARFKIRSQISQDKIIPYIDHIESYAGLVRMENYGFSIAKERPGALEMELSLDFFLAPKEWISKEALAELEGDDEEGPSQKNWKEIFLSTGARDVAATAGPSRLPVISKIVGRSVVANESLYEEGDSIAGWKIQSIDNGRKRVILRWGSITKEVSVK